MNIETNQKCSIDGCDKGRVAKGYCMSHYQKNRKTASSEDAEVPEQQVANTPDTQRELKEIEALMLPYPEFERLPEGDHNMQDFAKFTANAYASLLHERPEHPNREKIEAEIKEQKRIAEMDECQFISHQLYEANPLHKLDQDEKLHCIRTLPIAIVKKLFPHL